MCMNMPYSTAVQTKLNMYKCITSGTMITNDVRRHYNMNTIQTFL